MLSAPAAAPVLGGAAATAWLTLAARARAAQEAASGFADACAVNIAARLHLQASMRELDASFVQGVLLRTQWFDHLAASFFAQRGHGTAITLGAGFCTRCSRLRGQLPARTDWLNIDLPEVMAWRNEHVPLADIERNVAGSMLNLAWLAHAALRPGEPVLVLLEGVCPYLPQMPLENFLRGLATHFQDNGIAARLALDFTHPALAHSPMRVGGVSLPVVSGFKNVQQIANLHASLRLVEQEHPFSRFSSGHARFEAEFVAACDEPPYTLACLDFGNVD